MDTNPSMSEFLNEDHCQDQRIKTLEDKHWQMNAIIEKVENTPRHMKSKVV